MNNKVNTDLVNETTSSSGDCVSTLNSSELTLGDRQTNQQILIQRLIDGQLYTPTDVDYMDLLTNEDIDELVKFLIAHKDVGHEVIKSLVYTYREFLSIRLNSQEFWTQFLLRPDFKPEDYKERHQNSCRLRALTEFQYKLSLIRLEEITSPKGVIEVSVQSLPHHLRTTSVEKTKSTPNN